MLSKNNKINRMSFFSAAIVGFAVLPGTFAVPILMGKWGRKTTNIISIVPTVIGWLLVAAANSVTSLIVARLIQGFSMGLVSSLAPILIGEYSSPKYRGMFLSTISLSLSFGVVLVQLIGLWLSWQTTALFFAATGIIILGMVIFSPESPSWLIDQGRYEEGKRTFRWLRENDEEDELKKMIAANLILNESKGAKLTKKKVVNYLSYINKVVRKPEFYKPIIIMIHLNALLFWGGLIPFTAYPVDLIHLAIGPEADVSTAVISLGILRLISNVFTVYVTKKAKRRTLLLSTVGLVLIVLLTTAAYTFARTNGMLPYDSPYLGYTLLYIHMFSMAIGTQTLPFIIAGELYPLEYRSLASAISLLPNTPHFIFVLKSVPFLFKTVGLHGTYCLYGAIVGYCLVVTSVMLPETKDRTLLDIENEFKGQQFDGELKCTELLERD